MDWRGHFARRLTAGTNVAETDNMDRRDTTRRAELVRSVVAGVVRNPYAVVTLESLQNWLHVPGAVAERILHRLVSSGLLREVQAGVWARAPQG
jgi:hypothetical protein